MRTPRDGYGRCAYCGLSGDDHTETCRYRREWRALRMDEHPPPGPTRTGVPFERDGIMVAPILVYAPVALAAGDSPAVKRSRWQDENGDWGVSAT